MAKDKIKLIEVNGKPYDVVFNSIGKVVSKDGTEYTIGITNQGEIYAYSGDTDPNIEEVPVLDVPSATEIVTKHSGVTQTFKMYINEAFCGGSNADEHTIGYCSHNFVELSNLTVEDINLSGMSLQYAEAGIGWYVLPLKGVIKSGSTFLIRGAACSVYDVAKIKVDDYDMEWRIDSNGDYDPNGDLIKFSNVSAKFYLVHSIEKAQMTNPFAVDGIDKHMYKNYISLLGITNAAGGYELKPYPVLDSTKLYKQYYEMDPVNQATKDTSARDNSKWINYVDLTKDDGEVIPSIENFTPRASSYGKNVLTTKTKLKEDKPSMITCSFGIQATDAGQGATRCFNWLSLGIHNEYIWIRSKGSNDWGTANESFSKETGVRAIYNRKTREYAGGTVVTAHKFIKKNLVAGTYEYVAGHANADGTPNLDKCTPIHEFTVRTDTDVNTNGFTFVQTSDQQGFNWDEYQVWKIAAKTIMKEDTNNDIEFTINTGDIAQNGNRINEWLDYFDAKEGSLDNMEEMATIGNNDCSPKVLYKLGNGADECKLSTENFEFFFTSEIDENNPPIFTIDSVPYFIPSLYSFNYGNVHFLCMNTEIKANSEKNDETKDIYQSVYPFSESGKFYPLIEQWCKNDLATNATNSNWNIMYCHEMPFTILVTGVTNAASTWEGKNRTGSNANTNTPNKFWLSELCQTHNIRLVIGGHKHTQSTSWPLLENVSYNGGTRTVDSYRPVIVLSADNTKFAQEIAQFALDDTHIPDSLTTVTINGVQRKFPNTWVSNGEFVSGSASTVYQYLCEFERENTLSDFKTRNGITADTVPVVYAMSQATGYKHTSNKELPAAGLPWQRHYFPIKINDTKPLAGQKYPFYTLWTVKSNEIEGKVRKVNGAFNSDGTHDINIDGVYTRQGINAVTKVDEIQSIDGYTGSSNGVGISYTTSENIKITK